MWDGQLITAGTESKTLTGNGGVAYLYNGSNSALFTIGSNAYAMSPNTSLPVSVPSGSFTAAVSSYLQQPSSTTNSVAVSLGIYPSVGLFGNGYFLTAFSTYPYTYFLYSTNATTWTYTTGPNAYTVNATTYTSATGFISACYYANGKSSLALVSTSGTSWTTSSLPSNQYWYLNIAGNGMCFLSYGSGGAYTTNGTTWTAVSSGMPPQGWGSSSTIGGGGYWMALNGAGTTDYSLSTSLYSGWTSYTLPTGCGIGACGYLNGQFVVVNTSYVAYSTNGTTWTTAASPLSVAAFNSGLYSPAAYITYGGGYYILVGYGIICISTNLTSWSYLTSPYISPFIYGNSIFCQIAGQVVNYTSSFSSYQLPVQFGIYAGPTTTH
jgi:hypothetical protein